MTSLRRTTTLTLAIALLACATYLVLPESQEALTSEELASEELDRTQVVAVATTGSDGDDRVTIERPTSSTTNRVSGTVRDSWGAPAANVKVVLAKANGWSAFDSEETLILHGPQLSADLSRRTGSSTWGWYVTTNEQGKFSFAARHLKVATKIAAVSPIHGSRLRSLDDRANLDLQFAAGWRIQGKVVNARRDPIAGASVHVYKKPRRMPIAVLTSNKNGQFETPVLPRGDYALMADKTGHESTSCQRISREQISTAGSITLVLRATQHHPVALVDSLGRAWTMTRLRRTCGLAKPETPTFYVSNAPCATHQDLAKTGARRVGVKLDGAQLILSRRNRGNAHLSAWVHDRRIAQGDIAANASRAILQVQSLASETTRLRVEVRFDPPTTDPTPVKVQIARLLQAPFPRFEELAKANGNGPMFSFSLAKAAARTCWARASAPGWHGSPVQIDVAGTETGEKHCVVTLKLAAGSIQGVVRGRDGRPTSSATVALLSAAGARVLTPQASQAPCQPGGSYQFHNLPNGRYLVYARSDGTATACATVTVNGRRGETQDLQLGEGRLLTLNNRSRQRTLRLRVLAADGTILDDDRVFGVTRNGSPHRLRIAPAASQLALFDAHDHPIRNITLRGQTTITLPPTSRKPK